MQVRRLARILTLIAVLAVPGHVLAQSARAVADMTIAEARAAMLIDPATAQAKARVAEGQVSGIADAGTRGTMQATALWLHGEAAFRLKNFDVAAVKLREALVLAQRYARGSKLEADVLLSSGSLHGETGQIVLALSEFQRAHALFVRTGDTRKRAITLICIASLYIDAKDYTAALKYLDQALGAYDGDPGLQISIRNNRAAVLRNLGRYAEAERQFRGALALAEQMGSRVLEAHILRNIARTELNQDDVAGAERTIERGQALAGTGDRFNQQAFLAAAAQAALQAGRTRMAATLIDRSFAGVNLRTTPASYSDAHTTAYQVFRATGQNDKAFVHLLALKRLDDQTTQLATSTGAALMAGRFDYANQELRIARLKADDLERRVETARAQARVQKYIFYGGAGTTAVVIAALLTGLIVVRRSRDKVRAANADLGLANDALGKALAAKTEFLATTSHEIRTPLNGILGMTQVMLADETLSGALRDRLTVVHGAGTTMRALVDDILDVAKMENGKLVLETAPFDLRATITDATRLWEAQGEAKGIVFRRMLDDCPKMVVGDGARVRQVVFNLLSNAFKFTEAGEISIAATRRDDGQVEIAVRDSGIGIPADKLEAIFDSFRQADAGTTRRFGGTGLGLSICRQLARAMGGDVAVESSVGRGSAFTVMLPLAAVVPATAGEMVAVEAPALLVVERNPIVRSLYRTLLEPHAGRIVFASDAKEAAVAIEGGGIVQVLVDDAAVGGEDAVRRIVAAAGPDVRVTLLWPAPDEAQRQVLLDTGVAEVVAKPVSGPLLVATLFRERNDPLVRRAA